MKLPLTFAPMDEATARAVAAWQYPPPYEVYNFTGGAEDLADLLCPEYAYYAARDATGALVGFCCFGPDARVAGGFYDDETALDVGLGLRPDLTGRGFGLAFVMAVLRFAYQTYAPPSFRLTVATFNARAARVYEKAGFVTDHAFVGVAGNRGMEFMVMTRPAGGLMGPSLVTGQP